MVEQRTENPCVPGSIPGGGTEKAPEKGAFIVYDAFTKAGLVEKFGTGITKMIDSCKDAGNPEPLFETASTGLDFCVTFKASRIYRALEKYRELNNDAVVDYRKVLAQMDKLTEGDEPNVRINNNDVRINGTINGTDGTITKTKTPSPDSQTNDYVYSRKNACFLS